MLGEGRTVSFPGVVPPLPASEVSGLYLNRLVPGLRATQSESLEGDLWNLNVISTERFLNTLKLRKTDLVDETDG